MMSLQDQIEKVKSPTISQIKLKKQQLKLCDRLSITEIIDELHQRVVEFTSILTKKDLMDILNLDIHEYSYSMHCGMITKTTVWRN